MNTNPLQGQLLRRLAERGGRSKPEALGLNPKAWPSALRRCRQMGQVERHDDGAFSLTPAGRLAMLSVPMRAALLDMRERGTVSVLSVTGRVVAGATSKPTAAALERCGLVTVTRAAPKRPPMATLTDAGAALADAVAEGQAAAVREAAG